MIARRAAGLVPWVVLAVYLGGLTLPGAGFEPTAVTWLSVLSEVIPALLCWWAAWGAGPRRREVTVAAVGMSTYAAGATLLVVAGNRGVVLPFPSAADLGFNVFYVAITVSIALAVRRELGRMQAGVVLDSLLGALGGATVLAVLLGPVLEQASGSLLQVVVAVSYPLFDLLLVATVIGIAAVQGGRVSRHWIPLLSGLLLFAAADIVYALRVSHDSYVAGTPLDGIWAVAMLLISIWARSNPPAEAESRIRPPGLAVPILASLAGLSVLVIATTRIHVSVLAVVLATVTLLGSVGRTHLAFRQLVRVADLRRQATTDDLTALPNRRAFYADANARLSDPGRPWGALLLLDLDRFKEVNDGLGHHAGDQLLIQIGARLAQVFQDDEVLARLGGDEFAVLVSGVDQDAALIVAAKMRAVLSRPLSLEGIEVSVDASIGLSLFPEHGTDVGLLLRRADIAMYRSKKAGSRPHVFTGSEDAVGDDRLRTLQDLRAALSQGQFILHYQPKVDLGTGAVHSVEALVRWQHPDRGLLYPDSFLDLVEDSGLMAALTQQVLDQALDQAARWQDQGLTLTVAVNLSASSLLDIELPDYVAACLAARRLGAEALQLEITEEFLMTDRARARDILVRLREHGVQISIDDFGTGYSSLTYLRELPIDELKLDRSFVFPMIDDTRAAALVRSTIALAHSLGLRVVAEGVETALVLDELTAYGCDQAQGYYLSRPVPAADLEHWLDQRTNTALPFTRS